MCKGQISEIDSDIVCIRCGMVYDQHVVNYEIEESFKGPGSTDGGRTGYPVKQRYGHSAISSVIGSANKDAFGIKINDTMNTTIKRLRIWDTRTKRTSAERSMIRGTSEITKLVEKMGLSEFVLDSAVALYHKIVDMRITRGRNINVISAAVVYSAAKDADSPRTLHEVSEVSGIKKADISAIYRYIFFNLDMKIKVVDPSKYVSRVVSRLPFVRSQKVARLALKIIKESDKHHHTAGKDPLGMAAMAVYLASRYCGEDVTQRQVADAGEVTEVTIRNRMKIMEPLFEKW